jgi:polyferredoxin
MGSGTEHNAARKKKFGGYHMGTRHGYISCYRFLPSAFLSVFFLLLILLLILFLFLLLFNSTALLHT